MTATPFGIAPSQAALPASLRLGGVTLQISSLARSLPFYRDVLGLRVLSTDDSSASLGATESDEALVTLHERPGVRPLAPRSRLGLFHVAILLPDRASLGRFITHLARQGIRVGAADHLVSEALYLSDPDGLGIEIYSDRPRETWQHRGRELLMASEPLDLRELAGAGVGQPWRGAPAGTTVGHVHLHVGDLDRASTFYHDLLGFDKVVWSYPGALFLSTGGYHHHLGLNVWAAGAPAPGDLDAKLLHWDIQLSSAEEVEQVYIRLESQGQRPTRIDRGLVVQDPWGTTLRLLHR